MQDIFASSPYGGNVAWAGHLPKALPRQYVQNPAFGFRRADYQTAIWPRCAGILCPPRKPQFCSNPPSGKPVCVGYSDHEASGFCHIQSGFRVDTIQLAHSRRWRPSSQSIGKPALQRRELQTHQMAQCLFKLETAGNDPRRVLRVLFAEFPSSLYSLVDFRVRSASMSSFGSFQGDHEFFN